MCMEAKVSQGGRKAGPRPRAPDTRIPVCQNERHRSRNKVERGRPWHGRANSGSN